MSECSLDACQAFWRFQLACLQRLARVVKLQSHMLSYNVQAPVCTYLYSIYVYYLDVLTVFT